MERTDLKYSGFLSFTVGHIINKRQNIYGNIGLVDTVCLLVVLHDTSVD